MSVFNFDLDGHARGQCRNCDCHEWLMCTCSAKWGDACGDCRVGSFLGRPRAYNSVSRSEHTVNVKADLWARKMFAQPLPDYAPAPLGTGCLRCGCSAEAHVNLADYSKRLQTLSVELESTWGDLERMLFWQTNGLLRPELDCLRRCSRTPAKSIGDMTVRQMLVSVICPTGGSRHSFLPALFKYFCAQTYPEKELIVVDTSTNIGPCAFFTSGAASTDKRVIYKHFDVDEKQWTIGLKRNIACYLASGDIIAHFDDDDIYTPQYLAEMVNVLRHGQIGIAKGYDCDPTYKSSVVIHTATDLLKNSDHASIKKHIFSNDLGNVVEAATLSAWHTYNMKTRSLRVFDVTEEARGSPWLRSWAYGYGFSFVYYRDTWRRRWFRNLSLGEDSDFMEGLLVRGARVALLQDFVGLCAHCHHDANTSKFEESATSVIKIVREGPLYELACAGFQSGKDSDAQSDSEQNIVTLKVQASQTLAETYRDKCIHDWSSSVLVSKAKTLIEIELVKAHTQKKTDLELGLVSLVRYMMQELNIEVAKTEMDGAFFTINPHHLEAKLDCDQSILFGALFHALVAFIKQWSTERNLNVSCHLAQHLHHGIVLVCTGFTSEAIEMPCLD